MDPQASPISLISKAKLQAVSSHCGGTAAALKESANNHGLDKGEADIPIGFHAIVGHEGAPVSIQESHDAGCNCLQGLKKEGKTGIFHADDMATLKEFVHSDHAIGVVERKEPEEGNELFQLILQGPLSIEGVVRKAQAEKDIMAVLESEIPHEAQEHSFFKPWIKDMAGVCITFCDMQSVDAVRFWLSSERGCRRFHVDHVPMRLLVTYAGKGTEWIPDEAADRNAFATGQPNGMIVKNAAAIQFMNPWDVAVFRGGTQGVLHRTPDEALVGCSSLLMRLDLPWIGKRQH